MNMTYASPDICSAETALDDDILELTSVVPELSHDPAVKDSAILLLGNYRPALAIARALSARGYRIVMGLEGDGGGCEHSRHVWQSWDHPRLANDPAAFRAALKAYLADRPDIVAVFPVAEEFVHCLAEPPRGLPERVKLVSPGAALVRLFSDKLEALALAKSLDVPVLPYRLAVDYGDLIASARAIGFPLTLRPLGTTARIGHKKALIFKTMKHLRSALPDWPAGHKFLLLQRFASGRRHNVYFAARDGKLLGVVESRIARTNHPDGTGLAVDGETVVPSADLVGDTERLARETGYTGVGLAQFIVDEERNTRCFLELNPRVAGSHAVAELAGLPLSGLAVDLAMAPAAVPLAPVASGRAGMRYVWTCGDVIGTKFALMRGEAGVAGSLAGLTRALWAALCADVHMTWSWRDPKPSLRALVSTLPRFNWLRTALQGVQVGQRAGNGVS
ncbi:MAG: hypothetical protein ACR2PM_05830 [Hyphomicrobiales bacterium]